MYEGSSTMTRSPGSRNTRPTRSRPCWDPSVTSTWSREMWIPSLAIHFTSSSRRRASPSVGPYCKTRLASRSSSPAVMALISSTGNVAGSGKPPAKEMMFPRRVSLSSSRMRERVITRAHDPEEHALVEHGAYRPLARLETNDRRFHLRRRHEGGGRKGVHHSYLRAELRRHRQDAIVFRARTRGQPPGHLTLYGHDHPL